MPDTILFEKRRGMKRSEKRAVIANFREVILPAHSVVTNDRLLDKITLGTITVN